MVVVVFPQNWQALEQIPNKDLYCLLLAAVMIPAIQSQNMVLFCETGKGRGSLCLSLYSLTAEVLQQENLCDGG